MQLVCSQVAFDLSRGPQRNPREGIARVHRVSLANSERVPAHHLIAAWALHRPMARQRRIPVDVGLVSWGSKEKSSRTSVKGAWPDTADEMALQQCRWIGAHRYALSPEGESEMNIAYLPI